MKPVARRPLSWRGRLAYSAVLAYPASGALFALAKISWMVFARPLNWQEIPFDLAFLAGITVMTSVFLGFVPRLYDDGGDSAYINLYPLIVPTAAAIFFFWSRGWRWFSRKP